MLRTDLAAEAAELYRANTPAGDLSDGIRSRDYEREGFAVTRVEITKEEGAAALGKPKGNYITLFLDGLLRREEDAFSRACRALAAELRPLLPEKPDAPVLVAGIGNERVTPDAVGPLTMRFTLATRHVVGREPAYFGAFRPVAAVSPGVLGTTGIETAELLRGIVDRVRPVAMVVVDALASRRAARLCRTVQISDTGLAPGSGMGGDSAAIDRGSFGIPVIALGVPTVVDTLTLTLDVLREAGLPDADEERLCHAAEGMMVTPKDVDARVADAAKLLGYGLNLALHEGLTLEDVDLFLS